MQISIVDPADTVVLSEINELEAACYRADGRRRPPPSLAETAVEWTRGFPGSQIVPLQARLDGRLAGCALADLPVLDNTANAFVSIAVHPDLRGQGVGAGLAEGIGTHLRERGRKMAIGRTLAGGPGAGFAGALGAARQQDSLYSVLELDQLDRTALAASRATAAEQAAGYSLLRVASPVPAEVLPDVAAMYQVMNDAPHESSSFEDEHWPPDRVAQGDRWRADCGMRLYSVLAFRQDSGQVAGMTRIAVRNQIPMADQLDTSVEPKHRGHRLGYLLKASMLEWLMTAEPAVRSVGTWNAAGNAHMLAINTALGYAPAERLRFFERAV